MLMIVSFYNNFEAFMMFFTGVPKISQNVDVNNGLRHGDNP